MCGQTQSIVRLGPIFMKAGCGPWKWSTHAIAITYLTSCWAQFITEKIIHDWKPEKKRIDTGISSLFFLVFRLPAWALPFQHGKWTIYRDYFVQPSAHSLAPHFLLTKFHALLNLLSHITHFNFVWGAIQI